MVLGSVRRKYLPSIKRLTFLLCSYVFSLKTIDRLNILYILFIHKNYASKYLPPHQYY
jgi:hypothetical protein